ncbi:MAG: DUF4129 domain-containing protein [Cellulomonadaceae bacterium]
MLGTLGELGTALHSVPVDPDAPTARRWLEEELTDPIYHQGPGLVQRIVNWLAQQLDKLLGVGDGLGDFWLAVVVAVAVAVVVVVALLVAGPVRRRRRAARSAPVLGPEPRTAAELRAAASAHAASGRWREATLDRFRALVRALEERAVLDERPGRTADEAAAQARERFPAAADALNRAARLFDDLLYGDRPAGPESYETVSRLDDALAQTRPTRTDDAAQTPADLVSGGR